MFARARHAAADSYRQAARHRRHLHKKAALAHPGTPLHQDDRTGTGKNLVQVLALGGERPGSRRDSQEGNGTGTGPFRPVPEMLETSLGQAQVRHRSSP